MSRRSTAQSRTDDLAFPVRLKIAVPPFGLGKLSDEIHRWLRKELAAGDYACHSTASLGTNATAAYFRTVADAQRFLEAIPDLELADGTTCRAYSSASKTRSR